jgi:parallel beta-helix repeat protein
VRIDASGVTFGKKKQGFTVTGSTGEGLMALQTAEHLTVTGNRASHNGDNGFDLAGPGTVVSANVAVGNGSDGFSLDDDGNVLTGNRSLDNAAGGFDFDGSQNTLIGNEAVDNGFDGFAFVGDGNTFTGNVASGSEIGFSIEGGAGDAFTGNAAVGNGEGIALGGTNHVLTGNAIVGSRGVGLFMNTGATGVTVTKSNFIGNNTALDTTFTNCGLVNQSGAAATAANNFWGAAAGPGSDPADQVCDDGAGSTTTFAPPAAKEFKVKTKVAP